MSTAPSTPDMRPVWQCRRIIAGIANRVVGYMKNVAGSGAMMFALGLPASLGAVGIGADFAIYTMKHSALQAAADQAAIAAAKQFSIASSDSGTVEEAAESFAKVAMAVEDDGSEDSSDHQEKGSVQVAAEKFAVATLGDTGDDLIVKAEVDSSNNRVKVTIEDHWTPFFAHFLKSGVTPIIAHATAGLFGESKICVLALGASDIGVVSMTKNSHLQANGCTIYSNSSNSASVYLGDSSSIEAEAVCTVGGVKDNGSLNGKKVVTDCPVLADPLAGRPTPPIGPCLATDLAYTTGSHDLKPGVYCGGLRASGDAVLNFASGNYIIKDGLFAVYDKAVARGNNVGFYMSGAKALLQFRGNATIDLSGREEGLLAGMLMYDDPKGSILRIHTISATNAHTLTGTIYIPKGNLIVDPAASVGEKSAYTAIVAKRLVVQNGPTLVLNTNYNATSVPVPEGIRATADIHLVD